MQMQIGEQPDVTCQLRSALKIKKTVIFTDLKISYKNNGNWVFYDNSRFKLKRASLQKYVYV
jgi:hypothetical protein